MIHQFKSFLESLITSDNKTLVESIINGYKMIFESPQDDEILDLMRLQGISWDEANKQLHNVKETVTHGSTEENMERVNQIAVEHINQKYPTIDAVVGPNTARPVATIFFKGIKNTEIDGNPIYDTSLEKPDVYSSNGVHKEFDKFLNDIGYESAYDNRESFFAYRNFKQTPTISNKTSAFESMDDTKKANSDLKGFVTNIEKDTVDNNYFRKVLYTGKHSQLVLMALNPREDIGEEIHKVDQFFRIDQGKGQVIINDVVHEINNGSAFVVPAGAKHNVINTDDKEDLRLYSVYSPPHHKDGTIHKTKKDAMESKEHYDDEPTES